MQRTIPQHGRYSGIVACIHTKVEGYVKRLFKHRETFFGAIQARLDKIIHSRKPGSIFIVDADGGLTIVNGAQYQGRILWRFKIRTTKLNLNRLFENNIVYAPDYLVNSGGVIAISAEIYDTLDKVDEQLEQINDRTMEVLVRSKIENIPTDKVSREIAWNRINNT